MSCSAVFLTHLIVIELFLAIPGCTPLYLDVPNSICSYLIIPLLSHTFNMSCSSPAFLTHLIKWTHLAVPGCTWMCLVVPCCSQFYLFFINYASAITDFQHSVWLLLKSYKAHSVVPNFTPLGCSWLWLLSNTFKMSSFVGFKTKPPSVLASSTGSGLFLSTL